MRTILSLLQVLCREFIVEIDGHVRRSCIYGTSCVHRRVHGPQNRMKIEGSQQLNFRRKNDLGT